MHVGDGQSMPSAQALKSQGCIPSPVLRGKV